MTDEDADASGSWLVDGDGDHHHMGAVEGKGSVQSRAQSCQSLPVTNPEMAMCWRMSVALFAYQALQQCLQTQQFFRVS